MKHERAEVVGLRNAQRRAEENRAHQEAHELQRELNELLHQLAQRGTPVVQLTGCVALTMDRAPEDGDIVVGWVVNRPWVQVRYAGHYYTLAGHGHSLEKDHRVDEHTQRMMLAEALHEDNLCGRTAVAVDVFGGPHFELLACQEYAQS